MDSITICKNCNHSISGFKLPYIPYKWNWMHYEKKDGSKHGTRRINCFFCECRKPEPIEKEANL